MREFEDTSIMISELLETVNKVSENISPHTINYDKNKKKLEKMKEIYKTDAKKFAKKYLIDEFSE